MGDLVWLTRYGPEGASSRYRAYQIADGLEQQGWRSTIESLAPWRASRVETVGGLIRRLRRIAVPTRPWADSTVVVQKEPVVPPALFRAPARGGLRSGRRLVWDIDDAVWVGRSGAEAMAVEMARMADIVVAGNHLLAEWVDSAGGRAMVIPTCYDPPSRDLGSPIRSSRSDDAMHLLWIGSPATAALLEPFEPVLVELLERLPGLRLRFIGGVPPTNVRSDLRTELVEWSVEAEAAGLDWADYGLALQERNEYNDHKCGFKVVQYMSCGVVPLASSGPVHETILGPIGMLLDPAPDVDALVGRLGARPSQAEVDQVVDRWEEAFSVRSAIEKWATLLGELDRNA